MTPLDIAALVVVAGLLIRGFMLGAKPEAAGLAIFGVLFVATVLVSPRIAGDVSGDKAEHTASVIATIAIFAAAFAAWTTAVAFFRNRSRALWRGRTGGALLAGLQGLMLMVGLAAFMPISDATERALLQSAVYDRLQPVAERLRKPAEVQATVVAALQPASETPASALPAAAARPVAWTIVEHGSATVNRTLHGTIRAAERAPIGFDVPGRVVDVSMEIGESFNRGDVLARIEADTLQFEVEERRSALIEAEAILEEARADFGRTQYLAERQVESQAALDRAQAALDTARSRVEVAQTRLSRAMADLEDAELKAPYDGSVAARLVEPSERVTAGQPVLEIQSRDGGLELIATAPETILGDLEIGSTHRVSAAAADRDVDAVLTEIGSRAGDNTGFPITLTLTEPPRGLWPGMSAEVSLRLSRGEGDVARIPVTAFVAGEDQVTYVFVIGEGGTIERRSVEIRSFSADEVIVEGLEEGATIAIAGVHDLTDGQIVDLMGVGIARYNP